MKFEVLLTADAERDLEDLHDDIAEHDCWRAANHVLDRLLEVAAGLAVEPQRGTTPKELRELGMEEFRQVFFKPYRVIYRVVERQVVVMVVADGRRELGALLARRVLGG